MRCRLSQRCRASFGADLSVVDEDFDEHWGALGACTCDGNHDSGGALVDASHGAELDDLGDNASHGAEYELVFDLPVDQIAQGPVQVVAMPCAEYEANQHKSEANDGQGNCCDEDNMSHTCDAPVPLTQE